MKNKVFISYSSADSELARSLAHKLNEAGIDVWYDREEIRWGDSLIDATQEALKSASAIIMIISKDYNESNWTAFERGAAHSLNKKILPIITDDSVKIPSDLSGIAFLYADKTNEDKIVKNIAAVLEK
jgi:predicted nucleotide-binding protein